MHTGEPVPLRTRALADRSRMEARRTQGLPSLHLTSAPSSRALPGLRPTQLAFPKHSDSRTVRGACAVPLTRAEPVTPP
jgi:hypothetical protein